MCCQNSFFKVLEIIMAQHHHSFQRYSLLFCFDDGDGELCRNTSVVFSLIEMWRLKRP